MSSVSIFSILWERKSFTGFKRCCDSGSESMVSSMTCKFLFRCSSCIERFFDFVEFKRDRIGSEFPLNTLSNDSI